jgi:DNA (cytosine-5)-methyltransferase 1
VDSNLLVAVEKQAIGFDAYNNDVTGDLSKTIDTGQDYHHVPNVFVETGNASHATTICFEANMSMQTPQLGELHPTLTRRHHASLAFKVRGGCDGGGKGYLGSDEVAFTISTHQDQHILPAAYGVDYENNASKAGEAIRPLLSGSKSGDGRPLPAIALQDCSGRDKSQGGPGWNKNVAYTLDTSALQGVATGWQVRRLTPVECERLQGFPDNFTNIEYRGKPAADGPRYKALGNSWAVPVGRWIMERIERFMP